MLPWQKRFLRGTRCCRSRAGQAYLGDSWLPVTVRRFPEGLDGVTELRVELPSGSDRGPLVHKSTLRLQGLRSAPAYRAYLGLCSLRNHYATHKGNILPVTVPEVQRDTAGNALDARGRVIVSKGGVPVQHWNNPRAMRTGRFIHNEELWWRLPWLNNRDLVALCFPAMPENTQNPRRYRQLAKQVLLRMAADGLILIKREYPNEPLERYQGRWKIVLTDHPARLEGS